ncbi:pyrophosphatase [Salicibibacter halophilus]|uniref:Pyrophosphatase n=1 Tax=Salicibibacter halophilus TaxID=2502791 RepID=A0A514LHD4_9BACI|nr:MazG-like family protein [Salicibibacter halophilus]QDI90691.1 pyrophosphatase [Salicibibacter halophilus]
MDFEQFQQYVKAFSKEKGFEELTIEQRYQFLVSEVGEVSDELLKLNLDPNVKEEETKINLGMEMFDVVWNVFDLANKLDIDLSQAFAEKMKMNESRTW